MTLYAVAIDFYVELGQTPEREWHPVRASSLWDAARLALDTLRATPEVTENTYGFGVFDVIEIADTQDKRLITDELLADELLDDEQASRPR